MSHKLDVMHGFVEAYNAGRAEEACRTWLTEDFECHEPPQLPQGGVFKGQDAPMRISAIYQEIWDIEVLSAQFLDIADSDLVASHFVMTWRCKATGKAMTQPIVELNTIRDGRIAKMQVFHFDPAGLVATMR